jgi:hypothetical protein
MSRLAAELAETGPPPEIAHEIERAVLAEFDRVKRRRHRKYWVSAAGAIAASVVGVWMMQHRAGQPLTPPPAVETQVEAQAEQPFVPIPYVLPPGPDERLEVVRMKLPVAALIAAGFRMQTADLGAEAEADVILGQDGRARAVRLISISSWN